MRKISKNFIIIFIVCELIFSLILPSISLAVIRENMNYDKALEEVQSVYGKSEQDAKDFILKSVMNKFDLSSEAAQKIIDARDEGLAIGKEEGIEEGRREQQIEMAKKMLEKNKPIEEIMEFTELTKEEIENIEK